MNRVFLLYWILESKIMRWTCEEARGRRDNLWSLSYGQVIHAYERPQYIVNLGR